MSGETNSAVAAPIAKVATAWAAVGFTSWADVASFLAALYTLLLILEWIWKKWVRPFCEDRGYFKRRSRRKEDMQ